MKRKQASVCKINKSWHEDRGVNRDIIHPVAEITDRLEQGSNALSLLGKSKGLGTPAHSPFPGPKGSRAQQDAGSRDSQCFDSQRNKQSY